MGISSFAIRILTVFAYTLPLVFCLNTCGSDGNLKFAFNQKEALANEEDARKFNFELIDSIFVKLQNDTNAQKFEEAKKQIKANNIYNDKVLNLKHDWFYRLKWPTDYSLSAVGIMEVKFIVNTTLLAALAIIIGLCVILSVLNLVLWPFLRKKKISLLMLTIQLILFLVFITLCLLNGITLEYGSWLLLFLLLTQLLCEINDKLLKQLSNWVVFNSKVS